MIRLEFIGRDIIRRNPMQFLDQLRAKYPTFTEAELHAVAGAEFSKKAPRHRSHVVHLFGRDILTDDLTTITAWQWVTPAFRRILAQADHAKRAALIDPKLPDALEQTYVWRHENRWIQEVSDSDVAVLRRSSARGWFRDVDVHGPYVVPRTWDFPVAERFEAPSIDEGKRFVADVTRKRQWAGR